VPCWRNENDEVGIHRPCEVVLSRSPPGVAAGVDGLGCQALPDHLDRMDPATKSVVTQGKISDAGQSGACRAACGALGFVGRRPFKLALLSIRMARFVDVNIGITPRNVRSEGVAPCK
jgi:hypothetical protein